MSFLTALGCRSQSVLHMVLGCRSDSALHMVCDVVVIVFCIWLCDVVVIVSCTHCSSINSQHAFYTSLLGKDDELSWLLNVE